MGKNTKQLRELWRGFECEDQRMVLIPFGPDKIRVAPPTTDAFEALAAVLAAHRYVIRTEDTDSYNCRTITGGTGKSLHSYGIALDVNWKTNPFLKHSKPRPVRFSDKVTQDTRAHDVRLGLADTDMTADMVADVAKIRTNGGVPVFEWGGSWRDRKDCMHFELDLSPDELVTGIDPSSVAGFPEIGAARSMVPAEVAFTPPSHPSTPHIVIARDGLRLRSGPSATADIARLLPQGTHVNVIARHGDWSLVDLQGDGQADGFMSQAFLRPTAPADGAAVLEAPAAARDVTGLVTADMAQQMFPLTPRANIAANLPFVLAGLRSRALGDKPMVLMALATIRAETEGFVPVDEGKSRFNTRVTPFDLYDAGTSIGANLGNTQLGDGDRFKGRGYVQLTGRSNYSRISGQIGVDIVASPTLANDPTIAGVVISQFLKNKEAAVRSALARDDLKAARKLVNGGSHGFERFRDAYERGFAVLPA